MNKLTKYPSLFVFMHLVFELKLNSFYSNSHKTTKNNQNNSQIFKMLCSLWNNNNMIIGFLVSNSLSLGSYKVKWFLKNI